MDASWILLVADMTDEVPEGRRYEGKGKKERVLMSGNKRKG